jgi:hypothetical protein
MKRRNLPRTHLQASNLGLPTKIQVVKMERKTLIEAQAATFKRPRINRQKQSVQQLGFLERWTETAQL